MTARSGSIDLTIPHRRLYTDIDPFCCAVLRARVADGGLPAGEVWERDIKTLTADELAPFTQVHLFAGIGGFPLGLARAGWPKGTRTMTAGFPCQDLSHCGNKEGIDGEQSGLWTEAHRLACTFRPEILWLENVAGLLIRGMGRVLADLARGGFDAEWVHLPAGALGAPHLRQRIFVVAYPSGNSVQDSIHSRTPGVHFLKRKPRGSFGADVPGTHWEEAQPGFCEMDDGVPAWVDRVSAYGNAIVPQCVEVIARAMIGAKA